MRRWSLLFASTVLVCSACTEVTPSTFVQRHGELAVEGAQLIDAQGEPIVLRGMSFGWHIWWPQFWNEEVVRWMRDDWHCTVLRAAMGIEHETGYLKAPDTSKTLVRAVVDACIENGLYVIIDWHDHNAHQHLEAAEAFFVEMAQTYGTSPNVIYEIYNEPTRESWETVKEYSEKTIAAIRAVDPDNIILVGSPHWDQDVHVVADAPITGFSNIMYTLHFYAATHKEWLRKRGDYALKKGIPIFVSEYGGCEASGDGPLDMEQWSAWIDWMEANKISWCKWSISDKDETCSVLVPGASATGGWALSDLKPSGAHTRELLRKLNPAPSKSDRMDRKAKERSVLSWLHTKGNKIVDASDKIRVLRGVNRSGLEYDKQGNEISREEIEYICNEGKAQIIRIPFNQEWLTHDPNYAEFLDTIIGWVSDCGAYVLLDLQWENTDVRIPPIPNKEAVAMWRDVALKYRDNPAVLYDLHNEAHDTTWEAWRERAIEMIEAIQAVHSKALIFVSGLDWAYDLRGWQKEPLPYSNIVYSTHPYPNKAEPWAWDEYFGDFSETHPVFAGEFGGGRRNIEWGEKLLGYFDEKGIGWTAWSWVDHPKLTQQDRRSPSVFGKMVKDALQAHARRSTE